MIVDVLYDGLSLKTGAQARAEPNGVFIALEAPMPVGTRLKVRGPEGERDARVAKVCEGEGAGVLVTFVDVGASPLANDTEAASAEPPQNSRRGKKGR